jgi:hypothetical protein
MSDGKKQGEENWRDATADDVAGIVRTGKPIPARFRDDEKAEWFISELAGWTAGMIQWYSTDDDFWAHCQVPVEPAPTRSPKDGCRMLEENEEPMPGDFINWGAGWNELTAAMFPLALIPSWFCRPIKEPVESGPPSSIGLTYCPWTDTVSKIVRTDASGKVVESISAPWKPSVGEAVRIVSPKHNRHGVEGTVAAINHEGKLFRHGELTPYRFESNCGQFKRWCAVSEIEPISKSDRPVPKGFRMLGDEPRLASDGYWSLSCKDWLVIGDRVEEANRDMWPAIRFSFKRLAPSPESVWSPDPTKVRPMMRIMLDPIEVRPIMQIRLPVPASVLGKLGDMLEKHYPGSTMRQVGGYLVFEEPIES